MIFVVKATRAACVYIAFYLCLGKSFFLRRAFYTLIHPGKCLPPLLLLHIEHIRRRHSVKLVSAGDGGLAGDQVVSIAQARGIEGGYIRRGEIAAGVLLQRTQCLYLAQVGVGIHKEKQGAIRGVDEGIRQLVDARQLAQECAIRPAVGRPALPTLLRRAPFHALPVAAQQFFHMGAAPAAVDELLQLGLHTAYSKLFLRPVNLGIVPHRAAQLK